VPDRPAHFVRPPPTLVDQLRELIMLARNAPVELISSATPAADHRARSEPRQRQRAATRISRQRRDYLIMCRSARGGLLMHLHGVRDEVVSVPVPFALVRHRSRLVRSGRPEPVPRSTDALERLGEDLLSGLRASTLSRVQIPPRPPPPGRVRFAADSAREPASSDGVMALVSHLVSSDTVRALGQRIESRGSRSALTRTGF
jgi:hypothetical protein